MLPDASYFGVRPGDRLGLVSVARIVTVTRTCHKDYMGRWVYTVEKYGEVPIECFARNSGKAAFHNVN